MEKLFLEVVNMSVTAAWVIAVVLLLRRLLRPVPKKYVCLLWLAVLFRLLCPISLEMEFSLIPQHQAIQPEIVYTTPQMTAQSEAVGVATNLTIQPTLQQIPRAQQQVQMDSRQVYLWVAMWLWAAGIAILCGYTVYSWLRLRRRLQEAVPDEDGVYLSDAIVSPFVFGIVKPRIYLPFGLEGEERQWVLLHERSHIARKDFLLKPLFWLAVMLHWLNPLVWIAWHFYSRDIELACDERAIASLNDNQKWCYSNTLLQLAVQPNLLHCPVAFGNNSVKQRIQHILRYKQAALGIVAVALAVIVMMMAALSVNPIQRYALSELRTELAMPMEEIQYAVVQWGAISVEVRDVSEIEMLRNCLAETQVQKKGRNESRSMLGADYLEVANAIYFYDADDDAVAYVLFNGDCSWIEPKGDENENCGYLAVQNPEPIQAILKQYGMPAKDSFADTTFYYDLNQDGAMEQLIVNAQQWEAPQQWGGNQNGEIGLAAYQEDGTVLFYGYLSVAHTGWMTYALCEYNGKPCVLQYVPYVGMGYAVYTWQLLSFDDAGKTVIVDSDHLEFNLEKETYQFDIDKILAYMEKAETVLQNCRLLISTEHGEVQYSTIAHSIPYDVEEQFLQALDEWLGDVAVYQQLSEKQKSGLSLEEKLQLLQNELYFVQPQYDLAEWLKRADLFDETQHELCNPSLTEVDDKQCAVFELRWREDHPLMPGRLQCSYAVSVMENENERAVQGRDYYQYDAADDDWIFLGSDGQMETLARFAEAWAQTWKDRAGKVRYQYLSDELQKKVDRVSMDEQTEIEWEEWMPMWVSDEKTDDTEHRSMFLRGSSPWPETWQIDLQPPETKPDGTYVGDYFAVITYDMMDSSQLHYVYEEALQCRQTEEGWRVVDCTVTVDYLLPDLYVAATLIQQTVLDGHDTWRLDTEQVALHFVHDYLELKNGKLKKGDREDTVDYIAEDGALYTLKLYHPIQPLNQSEPAFWAVDSYTYYERKQGAQEEAYEAPNYHQVRHKVWASMHVKQ